MGLRRWQCNDHYGNSANSEIPTISPRHDSWSNELSFTIRNSQRLLEYKASEMCPQTSQSWDFIFFPSDQQRSRFTSCIQQHKDDRLSYKQDKGVSSCFIIYSVTHCQVSASPLSTEEVHPKIVFFGNRSSSNISQCASSRTSAKCFIPHSHGETGWKWVSACPLNSKPILYTVFPSPLTIIINSSFCDGATRELRRY